MISKKKPEKGFFLYSSWTINNESVQQKSTPFGMLYLLSLVVGNCDDFFAFVVATLAANTVRALHGMTLGALNHARNQ